MGARDRLDATAGYPAARVINWCKLFLIGNGLFMGEMQVLCTLGIVCDSFSFALPLYKAQKVITGIALPSGSDKLYSGSKDECVRVVTMGSEVGCMISEGPLIFIGVINAVRGLNTQIFGMGSSEGGNVTNQALRHYSMTKPISTTGASYVDLQRRVELEKIVKEKIKQLTRQRGYTNQMVEEANAVIFTLGSYHLGPTPRHRPDSYIRRTLSRDGTPAGALPPGPRTADAPPESRPPPPAPTRHAPPTPPESRPQPKPRLSHDYPRPALRACPPTPAPTPPRHGHDTGAAGDNEAYEEELIDYEEDEEKALDSVGAKAACDGAKK
ncbi:uncharacterized protein A4U43_C04F21080 [Asparagus officinalis]|uniref:Uncharacterized protein n=1 Tax=Asparagus officinalis TaxID=4686 RepID=A0A5P1F7A0_ASPOF|nr:uncharacterized protein A4U43_C04F21080 [Asparagus officinalis]